MSGKLRESVEEQQAHGIKKYDTKVESENKCLLV